MYIVNYRHYTNGNYNKMGNLQLITNDTHDYMPTSRLSRTIEITNDQLFLLSRLVKQRSRLKHSSLCIIDKVHSYKSQNDFCQQSLTVVLQYEPIDHILNQIKHQFPLPANEIENIILSVCQSLLMLQQHNMHHGDISTHMICNSKSKWKLIDNCFINKGISSYQKVLQGEVGFISPKQMHYIRYGFLRQSPPINFADEVFALGMTCLQIMSGKSSKLCYRQSFLHYNEKHMNKLLNNIKMHYPFQLFRLVVQMLIFNQNQRISINQIISQPCINRHAQAISLRR